jgi:hypothetical protein
MLFAIGKGLVQLEHEAIVAALRMGRFLSISRGFWVAKQDRGIRSW